VTQALREIAAKAVKARVLRVERQITVALLKKGSVLE
jgi:hypothetical protein